VCIAVFLGKRDDEKIYYDKMSLLKDRGIIEDTKVSTPNFTSIL
jgi:hypothetical protein